MKTIQVPSSSNKERLYGVTFNDAGQPVHCTCKGFQFRRDCKHVQSAELPADEQAKVAVRSDTLRPMKFQEVPVADLPGFIEDDAWWIQQKLDGIRAQLVVAGGDVWSRASNGKPLKSTAALPVMDKVEKHFANPTDDALLVLDGEVLDGKFYVFDMPEQTFIDSDTPLDERLQVLEQLFTLLDMPSYIVLVPTARTVVEKRKLVGKVTELGGEGFILKRRDSTYEYDKRVKSSLKVKFTHTADVVVMEVGPGNRKNGTGNWLKFGVYRDDKLVEVGRCSIIGKPKAEPGDVIEVKYLYVGNGGRLTQPTHLRNREDKDARDCTGQDLVLVSKEVIEEL